MHPFVVTQDTRTGGKNVGGLNWKRLIFIVVFFPGVDFVSNTWDRCSDQRCGQGAWQAHGEAVLPRVHRWHWCTRRPRSLEEMPNCCWNSRLESVVLWSIFPVSLKVELAPKTFRYVYFHIFLFAPFHFFPYSTWFIPALIFHHHHRHHHPSLSLSIYLSPFISLSLSLSHAHTHPLLPVPFPPCPTPPPPLTHSFLTDKCLSFFFFFFL